jgi:predicted YcjX-like family ATPase
VSWLNDIADGMQRLVVGGVQVLSPWNLFSSTVRIGVTGLSRAGKTAFLTSVASLLLARTQPRFALAPLGAGDVPRFDQARHLAALAGDPPRWPERTDSVSMLAVTAQVDQSPLPSRTVRLEFLDYPGEWLLDLPLLTLGFSDWSERTLARLEAPAIAPLTKEFLGFVHGLPAKAPADEALAKAGTELYRRMLGWIFFFPARGHGPFASLLGKRYDAYVEQVRRSLASPLFAEVDRLVVLADVLSALHAGAGAFEDTRAALAAAAGALRWRFSWADALGALVELRMPPKVIGRVAFVATKCDHVAERQRGNLAALMRNLAQVPGDGVTTAHFAAASVRCTEDFVWTLEGRPVSAVRGRVLGKQVLTRSYPGEVPDQPPDASFWTHPFLALPEFEPMRLLDGGRLGVPNIGMDAVLNFLLQDVM